MNELDKKWLIDELALFKLEPNDDELCHFLENVAKRVAEGENEDEARMNALDEVFGV